MKKRIKLIIIKSKTYNLILRYLINALNFNSKEKLTNNSIDLFDWNYHKPKIKPYYFQPVIDNNFFGISYSINKYSGHEPNNLISFYIEHGYFFGPYISFDSKNYWCKKIITFGDLRKKHLKVFSIDNVHAIGPYIHYASNYNSQKKLITLKEQLGKTLLVFPMHASSGTRLDYNINQFFDFIENKASNYQSIIVSIFHTDLNNDLLVNECLKRNFKIFCAGNRYDQFFLSRLKDVITLSDMTVSNGPGTHVIYSVYMKKSHYIFNQKIEEASESKRGNKELSIYSAHEVKEREQEMNKLKILFSEYNEVLTDNQYDYCYKIFGFNKIKSREDMFNFLKN